MERIKVHDKYFKPFITNDKIEEAVSRVAERINHDFKPEDKPIILSILNGSFMFTASLVQKLTCSPEICFIKLSSYDGLVSTGKVNQLIGLTQDVKGRKIIISEDIIETGHTIRTLLDILKEKGAAEIRVSSLFIKPGRLKEDFVIDYPAMEIGDEFIVGFGLDYDQLGRNYKDIYIIED